VPGGFGVGADTVWQPGGHRLCGDGGRAVSGDGGGVGGGRFTDGLTGPVIHHCFECRHIGPGPRKSLGDGWVCRHLDAGGMNVMRITIPQECPLSAVDGTARNKGTKGQDRTVGQHLAKETAQWPS
jgi:hypothetical protein